MRDIITKSIKELNQVMPREKRLIIKDSTPLIDEKSKLESIDLVNLFVSLEKNLKEKSNLALTFDEIVENIEHLKTIGSLESFLVNKLKNEINLSGDWHMFRKNFANIYPKFISYLSNYNSELSSNDINIFIR